MYKRVSNNTSRKDGGVKTTRSKVTSTGAYSRRPPHTPPTPPKGTGTSNKGKK